MSVIGTLLGVRLFIEGKDKLADYGFTIKAKESFLDEKFTYDEAKILGVALYANGLYYKDASYQKMKELLEDWKERIENPAKIFDEVLIDSEIDLKNLISESHTGPKLYSDLEGKRIHFISFHYIVTLTNCQRKWQTLNWKLKSKRIERMMKVIQLPPHRLKSLAIYLQRKFQEN